METLGQTYNKILKAEKPVIRRSFSTITPIAFKNLFLTLANNNINSGNPFDEFIIDENNKNVLNQLFYYLVGDEKQFIGSLYKGIILVGSFGCGKTTIIKSFGDIYGMLSNKNVTFISSIELANIVTSENNNLEFFEKRPLIIDEIGRENNKVIDFGTKRQPMEELITLRYNSGALTFGTANMTLDTFSSDDYYGKYIGDRFKEMFNFIVLPGMSRRK